jgi:parvulin-like peptidyl-prolyl isomerase
VKDVLYKLRGKTFKIDSSRTTGIAVQLNFYLLVMVQQELLAEEGLSQKLDERSSVKDELDIWRQQILAKLAEMDFQKNIQVSDQDIMQYLEEFNSEARYPRVQIRELHTKDITSMDQSLMEVRAGVSFQEVIRKHSTDLRSAQNSGLSDEFPVNERMPLGMLCWRMQVGERTGPVHLQNDYIYFELVKKDYPTGESDSSFSSLMQKTANDASIFKKKKLLDIFIAKIAQQRGYAIYADRLKQLKVSNVPMMTYRILGFGGRMFAVPFVTRQVDWIGVENPDTIPLP